MDIRAEIKQTYQEILELPENFDEEKNFQQLGGTSILSYKLQQEIQKKFGIRISFRELFKHKKIEELSQYISEKI